MTQPQPMLAKRLRDIIDWANQSGCASVASDLQLLVPYLDRAEARNIVAERLARAVGGHHYHTANGEGPQGAPHSADIVNANRCEVCAALAAFQRHVG